MVKRPCAGRRAGPGHLGCRGNADKRIVPKAARDQDQGRPPYNKTKSKPKAVSDPSTDGATTLPFAVSPTPHRLACQWLHRLSVVMMCCCV